MSQLDLLLASLGPGGGDFERLCKWLLENAPEYRSQLRRVWLWQDWPGRWGGDAGIDLVAEDRDGGLWAVQAKHYDPAYAIKKADIDSFLSESSRPGFSYRIRCGGAPHPRAFCGNRGHTESSSCVGRMHAAHATFPNSLSFSASWWRPVSGSIRRRRSARFPATSPGADLPALCRRTSTPLRATPA